MQRAAIQTEWGGSANERVKQILCALNEPRARELLVAYEADKQDPTLLQTYCMDCLRSAPLQKLSQYVCGVYQCDKFPINKWSAEHNQPKNHLEPTPIMALHLDNTIKQGHEPTHEAFALSKGMLIQGGLENPKNTLEPEPAKTMVLVECPPETESAPETRS